jgi:hypothetical protein
MAKRAPHEQYAWSQINKQIGQQLRAYYEAALREELPPRLCAALKKLDEEPPEASTAQPSLIRDIEN